MIIPVGPMKMVGGFTPCGCGGKCPYGFPEGQCPGSTAGGWQSFVPDTGLPEDEVWLVDKRSGKVVTKIVNTGIAMRAEDV
jgi:hypothetical protein